METPNGHIIEWFYGDEGYGFELFIGGLGGRSVTDGKFYPSDEAAIQAGLAYARSVSQPLAPPASPSGPPNDTPPSPET